VSSIGDIKRSESAKGEWIPHPMLSCAAAGTWQALSTSGSVERFTRLCHAMVLPSSLSIAKDLQVQPDAF
jgi:hypothetical protein